MDRRRNDGMGCAVANLPQDFPARNPANPASFLLRALRHAFSGRITACTLLFALSALPALGGEVYLRGPDERGEGPLPIVTGMPPDVPNMGSFTVDVYAEDFPGFAGFQIQIDFPAGFYRYGTLTRNQLFLPEASMIEKGSIVGSVSQELVDPFDPDLGYLDKTIPAEEEDDAVNPQEMIWPGREGLTWLMTITFLYDATVAGTYEVNAEPDTTTFANADEEPLSYSVTEGYVTISGEQLRGDGERTFPLLIASDAASLAAELLTAGEGGEPLRDGGDCDLIKGNPVRDGYVNVIDMINVRNNLNAPQPLSEDAFPSDVNADGKVNILDLLFVRNHINQEEPVAMTAAWGGSTVSTTDSEPTVVLQVDAAPDGTTNVEFRVEAWLKEELQWAASCTALPGYAATFSGDPQDLGLATLLFTPEWNALHSYNVVVTATAGGCSRAIALAFTDPNGYLSVSPSVENAVYSPVAFEKQVTAQLEGIAEPGGTFAWSPAHLVTASDGATATLVADTAGAYPMSVTYTKDGITRSTSFTLVAFEVRYTNAVRPDESGTASRDIYTTPGTVHLQAALYPPVPGNVTWNWESVIVETDPEYTIDFGYTDTYSQSIAFDQLGGADLTISGYTDGFDIEVSATATTEHGAAAMSAESKPHVLVPTVAIEISEQRWWDDDRLPCSGHAQSGPLYFGAFHEIPVLARVSTLRPDADVYCTWELSECEAQLRTMAGQATLQSDASTSAQISLTVLVNDFEIGTYEMAADIWSIELAEERYYVGDTDGEVDYLEIPNIPMDHAPPGVRIHWPGDSLYPETLTPQGTLIVEGGFFDKFYPAGESLTSSRERDGHDDLIYNEYPAVFRSEIVCFTLGGLRTDVPMPLTVDQEYDQGEWLYSHSGTSVGLSVFPDQDVEPALQYVWEEDTPLGHQLGLPFTDGTATLIIPAQADVLFEEVPRCIFVDVTATVMAATYSSSPATIDCICTTRWTYSPHSTTDMYEHECSAAYDPEETFVTLDDPTGQGDAFFGLPWYTGLPFVSFYSFLEDPACIDFYGPGIAHIYASCRDQVGEDPDAYAYYPNHYEVIVFAVEIEGADELQYLTCNDDDDDSDGIVDSSDTSVPGEDDLLPLQVSFTPPLGFLRSKGITLHVESSPNIALWAKPGKEIPYDADVPSYLATRLYVEGVSPSEAANSWLSITLTNGTSTFSETLELNALRLNVAGAPSFRCVRKGAAIPLPHEQAKKFEASHFLFPADCVIGYGSSAAYCLVRVDGNIENDVILTDRTGHDAIEVLPDMFSVQPGSDILDSVNAEHDFLHLAPVTAAELYSSLLAAYTIDAQEIGAGKWWLTSALCTPDSRHTICVKKDSALLDHVAPITLLVKQPMEIVRRFPYSVARFELYEAEIILDDNYFHHLGKQGNGMNQADRFDAYDADQNGNKIIVDAVFRLIDPAAQDPVLASYDVPCFAMKEAHDAPFKWKVRFSPPEETLEGQYWEVTARAEVWHTASPDTDGNYDELNEDGGHYYHRYGYATNNHTGFYQNYDSQLPVPRLRFTCATDDPQQPPRPGPLRIAKGQENQRFFHRDFSDGTASPVYLNGVCRFVNLQKTDTPDKCEIWENAWIDPSSQLFQGLKSDSSHFAPVVSFWLYSPDSSLVHRHDPEKEDYEEEWHGFTSATRLLRAVDAEDKGQDYAYFDQGRADMLDRMFAAAAADYICLMPAIWGHPDLREPGDNNWPPRLWGPDGANKTSPWYKLDPANLSVHDFITATQGRIWDYQRNYYRYLVARYSSYPSMGIWEVVTEYQGIQGAEVDAGDIQAFLQRVQAFVEVIDPYHHPISSSSYGTGTYANGDYASTHAWGNVVGNTGINSQEALALHNNAEFRKAVVRIASVLPGECPTSMPWFHGESGVTERNDTKGEDMEVSTDDPVTDNQYFFKGITGYHYTMMADLLLGAAGTPQKWNDAKEFGEMHARDGNIHFTEENYPADYFGALDNHRILIGRMIAAGSPPWTIADRGGFAENGSTAGLWAKNTEAAVCWIYATSDTSPPATTVRDFTSAVPEAAQNYEFDWIDPWSGGIITSTVVPAAGIGSVDFWTGKMDQVLPAGFDNRHQEDVFVIIKKLN